MPLPLAPLATVAIRYGLVAATTWAIARQVNRAPYDQRAEDALNDLPEGLMADKTGEKARGAARVKRVIRLGATGPGIEIDISAIGRLSIKRLG
ncbi:MAG: hypothetical protein ABI459_07060 [Deltaproteobacteria bacterium]